ncbi:MAG: polysaccharide biosynthesis protein [Phycisphaerae bacterium]
MKSESGNAEALPTYMVKYRLQLVMLGHASLFAVALLAAFSLAHNFRLEVYQRIWFFELYLPLLLLALPIKLVVFGWTGQYRGSWRYVSLRDLFGVISSSLIGTSAFLFIYFLLENVSREVLGYRLIDNTPVPLLKQSAVFTLDLACTIGFVAAARILVRFYYEDVRAKQATDVCRVLIIGAGDLAEALLREMVRGGGQRYQCVGMLDDSAQIGSSIHGVEVLGPVEDVRHYCEEFDVKDVLIALPSASPRSIRQLVERCEGLGVHIRTIPAVSDLIAGKVKVSNFRDVEIADLLGREPVKLDTETIGEQLRGKVAMVTGAGGSIGSEICRQIAAFEPKSLILVERSENALFEIDRELVRKFPHLDFKACVADISDSSRLNTIFEDHRPSVVFHAAAHKHVPMMEINPGEAIKNNVGGTMAVARASVQHQVETMVMVSTDKAVNPTSVMGCSKRVAEMFVQSLTGRHATHFITVRFGNVLGSSGSVVPIFKRQIEEGGPVTVTDPEMVRFFMTIPEAAQLVLQAGTMGNGGEIYVLHMGDPVRIVDLARDMITLSGLRPGEDIEIVFSGRRPGEKLYEELSHEAEDIGDTAHPKIGIWKHRPEDHEAVLQAIETLLSFGDDADPKACRRALKAIVPEYTGDDLGAASTPQPKPQTPART